MQSWHFGWAFITSAKKEEYEELPPVTMWAVCFHCELRPLRGRADKSVCNHGAWEPTPRVNEKVRLTHVNTVDNLAAPRRLLWWMSLTYSMSREPHQQPDDPIAIIFIITAAREPSHTPNDWQRRFRGVFISVFLLKFWFWISWRADRPWSGPPTHTPTLSLPVTPSSSLLMHIEYPDM